VQLLLPKGKWEDWHLPRSPSRQISSKPGPRTSHSWGNGCPARGNPCTILTGSHPSGTNAALSWRL